ncbi:MAG: KamA family radical SAM protein [bacterium]
MTSTITSTITTDQVLELYPFAATDYYLALAKADNDPIMRQLTPSMEELADYSGLKEDPLAEEELSPVPGLVHRYPDRVLMIVTNICFMNCRHCTRKRLWKHGRRAASLSDLERMVEYIKEHAEIRDVIVSGGDPLTLSDGLLDNILKQVRQIPHVEIIRLGTRAPVVFPARITTKLVSLLKRYRPIWLNVQFNHVQEVTEDAKNAILRILEAGIPVNNQTVLLKGINDTVFEMKQLCQALLKIGVRPYYLFHCDPVAGVGHFRTSISKGLEIIAGMRGHTSGLAVPTYVVDAIGGGGKIPLQPDYCLRQGDDFILSNYQGRSFRYKEG